MTAVETEVRRATAEDAEAVTALVQRAYQIYLSRLTIRPRPMDDDYAAAIRDHETWVATWRDVVVGLLVLVPEETTMLLENVAVDPAYQRRGIGRALLALAERRARDVGTPAVRLYTNVVMVENQRLYESLGYLETDRRVEHGHGRVFYAKRLA